MTIGEFIPIRMREIMQEKGLEPVDFIRAGNDISEENMTKITSSRFYDVYNGVQLNVKIDFIQSFCDIADINFDYFFSFTPDEKLLSLTEKEWEIVTILRKLDRHFSVNHILEHMKMLLNQQDKK